MRLFIAVQFSGEMKKQLINYMVELKLNGVSGNFTKRDNLHLTLCFIGETAKAKIIKEAISKINFEPFKFSLSDTGAFRDLLYIGTTGGRALNDLANMVRNALDEAGIDYDRKKFKPHITLIRRMEGDTGKLKPPKAEMTVNKISLMKSERIDGRLVYTEI